MSDGAHPLKGYERAPLFYFSLDSEKEVGLPCDTNNGDHLPLTSHMQDDETNTKS